MLSSRALYLGMLMDSIRERLFPADSDYQVLGFFGQVPPPPISSREDVTATLSPHGIPGVICSPGSCPDAPSVVTAEILLVFSCGQSFSAGAHDTEMRGIHSLIAGGGDVIVQGSSPGAFSLSPSVH